MGIPALSIYTAATLSDMLIQASAYFQASSAKLVSAEGEKLQALVAAVTAGGILTDGYTALSTINSKIQLTTAALANLEDAIMQKVAAGTQIHNW